MTHVRVGPTDTNGVRTGWHSYSGGRCRPVAHTGLLVLLSTYVLPYFFWPSLWLDRAMGLISDKWGIEWKYPRTLDSQYVFSIPSFPWYSKRRNHVWFSRWGKPGSPSLNREEPLPFHKAFREQKTNLCCVKPLKSPGKAVISAQHGLSWLIPDLQPFSQWALTTHMLHTLCYVTSCGNAGAPNTIAALKELTMGFPRWDQHISWRKIANCRDV